MSNSENIDEVLRATGGHAAPAEVYIKDEEYDAELASDDPCWEGYKQVGMKKGKGGKMVPNCVPVDATVAATSEETEGGCPPATQDIQLNLENRQNAIDNVGYGPLNPARPNKDFWQDKADRWNTTVEEAKTTLCGNCVFFVRTPKMLDCLEEGIGMGEEAEGTVAAGELGYCNALDFKCASERTCNAWAAGGPVTEESQLEDQNKEKEAAIAASPIETSEKPVVRLVEEEADLAESLKKIADTYGKFNEDETGIWAGYETPRENEVKDIGVKCGNCVLYQGGGVCSIIAEQVEEEGKCRFAIIPDGVVSVTATAGSKPAAPSERRKGSKKNKKGSAAGGKKIKFSKKVTKALENKVEEHNEKHGDAKSKKTTLRTLKAVYRRGAGAFSTSHRPDQNRNSWAMARVNAFLYLLRNGRPKNKKYVTDNDLLPAAHKRSSKKSNSITAAAFVKEQTFIELKPASDYESHEHALLELAEFSDGSYDVLPALRAAYLRAENEGGDPIKRAALLATALYDSPDADLLPKELDIEDE